MTMHSHMRMIRRMALRHGILTARSLGRREMILKHPALQMKSVFLSTVSTLGGVQALEKETLP